MEKSQKKTLSLQKLFRFQSYEALSPRELKREFWNSLGLLPFIWQVLFFFIPMLLLFSLSFIDVSSGTLHITLQHFRSVFQSAYLSITFNSLGLALFTTCITLLIAFPFAYIAAFHFRRFRNILMPLVLIPFWTNFILHIYAWFFLLEKHGFINQMLLNFGCISEPLTFLNNGFSIMIMMIYYYLPFMIFPIYSTLERFDHSMIEASIDLGANKMETLWKIVLPLAMSGIKTGIFLVFIPSFAEFLIPELMGGDKYYFVGNAISLLIFEEKTLSVAVALTTLSLALLMLFVFGIQKGLSKAADTMSRGRKRQWV